MSRVKPRRAAKNYPGPIWNGIFYATILATAGLFGYTLSLVIWGTP